MKKFYIVIALITGTLFTCTHSMLQIILGTGMAGLGYTLYQKTASDNSLGLLREGIRAAGTDSGFGSPIEKLRRNVQNGLSNAIEEQPNESSIEKFQRVLRVEKILYCSTAILGAISVLYGLKDFFKKS